MDLAAFPTRSSTGSAGLQSLWTTSYLRISLSFSVQTLYHFSISINPCSTNIIEDMCLAVKENKIPRTLGSLPRQLRSRRCYWVNFISVHQSTRQSPWRIWPFWEAILKPPGWKNWLFVTSTHTSLEMDLQSLRPYASPKWRQWRWRKLSSETIVPQQVCICIHICVYAGGTSIETHRIN